MPLVVTAASVTAFLSAQAFAGLTGNPQIYTNNIIIDAPPASPFLDGTGAGTGTGFFDDSGTLTLQSAVSTSLPLLGATGTVYATTIYQGTISGTTWTYNGTATQQITACSGSALICSNAKPGPPSQTTGNPVFTLDILAGGTWNTVSSLATATLDTDHTLTPTALPPISDGPATIPTMSAYGLGITAIALFGAAARRLRSTRKRK